MGRIRTLGQFVSNLSKRDKKDLTRFTSNPTNPYAFSNYMSTRINPRTNEPFKRFNKNEHILLETHQVITFLWHQSI